MVQVLPQTVSHATKTFGDSRLNTKGQVAAVGRCAREEGVKTERLNPSADKAPQSTRISSSLSLAAAPP